MPKILKDGSKKSGYVTLSPRIKIREYDNLNGAYPTVHRLGDNDRSGNFNTDAFDDTNTIIYGKHIKDNFEMSGVNQTTSIDTKKWLSSSGMKIRNELIKKDAGQFFLGKSLVFEGNNLVRFIRTKEKVRNIKIVFELQQGPYNLIPDGLNLTQGSADDILKFQISIDGVNWNTIKEYIPTSNLETFYGKENIKKNIFKKIIAIGTQDISDPGESYYIRFAQESISNYNLATWAISMIDIEIANQNINLGYQIDLSQQAGIRRYQKLISSPHTSSNLIAIGASKKSISDNMMTIDNRNENITFFDETKSINADNTFFKLGTDPNVYTGFSQPAKDKTIFTIDLSPKQETTFGHNDGYVNNSSNDDVHMNLMVYWNNLEKKWEHKGAGFSFGKFAPDYSNTLSDIITNNSSSCLGFGPMPIAILTASEYQGSSGWGNVKTNGVVKTEFLSKDYIKSTVRPIDNFEFPFGDRYHANENQYILAKDLGITKPFVLEKCLLEFDAKFDLTAYSGYTGSSRYSAFHLNAAYTDDNGSGTVRPSASKKLRHLCVIPTFFMLRQSNINLSKEFKRKTIEKRFNSFSESTSRITSGSRELITYGQLTLITSGTNSNKGIDLDQKNLIQDVLNLGLLRDGLSINTSNAYGHPSEITGSYNINFPARLSPKYNDSHPTVFNLNYGSAKGFASVLLGDSTSGRSFGIDSTNRALVNGTGPKIDGNNILIPAATLTTETINLTPPNSDSIEKISPYVIFPSDKIIFGWQFPITNEQNSFPVLSNSSYLKQETMTLFGRSKLKLIGSLIANNREAHETINQNLTSNSIYEHVLGNEKIIDKWQIETSHEYSGSYLDNHFRINSTNREARIGIKSFSAVSGESGTTGSFGRYVRLNDQTRIYLDSKQKKNTFYDNSYYGTLNTNEKGISPKYYYNYEHFGYYSDLNRQSIDSKYDMSINITDFENISTTSPINIIFVKGEIDKGPNNRVYKRKEINELIDDINFQSSNINIFSTSSIPFIDDNKPRNRTYVSASYIAV